MWYAKEEKKRRRKRDEKEKKRRRKEGKGGVRTYFNTCFFCEGIL
jgi:hypothetical protein